MQILTRKTQEPKKACKLDNTKIETHKANRNRALAKIDWDYD